MQLMENRMSLINRERTKIQKQPKSCVVWVTEVGKENKIHATDSGDCGTLKVKGCIHPEWIQSWGNYASVTPTRKNRIGGLGGGVSAGPLF